MCMIMEDPPPVRTTLKYGDYLFMGRRTTRRNVRYQSRIARLKEKISMIYHTIPIDDLLSELQTDLERGLDASQVSHVLSRDGPNELRSMRSNINFIHFSRHLGSITVTLIIAVIISFVTAILPSLQPIGTYNMDGVYLCGILIASVFILMVYSYYVEKRRENITNTFRVLNPQNVIVLRDGSKVIAKVKDVVVGDIVFIEKGNVVPADVRIIEAYNLETDDSNVTGETEIRIKSPDTVHENPLKTGNVALCGTYCLRGRGKGVVIMTGKRTVIGQLSKIEATLKQKETPVYKEVKTLVRCLAFLSIVIGIILFALCLYKGLFWLDYLLYILILVIGNMPETLLSGVMAGVTLAARRMASKNCLLRDLETVEILGSISAICCSTKGFLTENNPILNHLWIDTKTVSCKYYKGLKLHDICEETVQNFIRAACLATETKFHSQKITKTEKYDVNNSIEHEIESFLEQYDALMREIRAKYKLIFEEPFNPISKFHVTIHKNIEDGSYVLIVRGDPQVIVKFCSSILVEGMEEEVSDAHLKYLENASALLMSRGDTLIGICDVEFSDNVFPPNYQFQMENLPLRDMRFLGMLGILDQVRPSATEAVRRCRNAGIKVLLLTGDHPISAEKAARSAGIISVNSESREQLAERLNISIDAVEPGSVPALVVNCEELKEMDAEELRQTLTSYEEIVFSNITPDLKLRIVAECRSAFGTVAMTGITVEDCPALRHANIGISMGTDSCDVCKEMTNVILLDNNLLTVVTAIEEGRLFLDNLRKSIAYVLTCKLAELCPIVMILMLDIPLPLGAVLVLLIFLGTSLLPALSLFHEKCEHDTMGMRRQTSKKKRLLNFRFSYRLLHKSFGTIGAVVMVAGMFTYFVIMAENGFMPYTLVGIRKAWYSQAVNDLKDDFNQEWTYNARKHLEYSCQTGFFITVVAVQWFSLILCRTSRDTILYSGARNYSLNFSLLFQAILALLICYLPEMNKVFHTFPMRFVWWIPGIFFGVLILTLDELRCFIIRHSNPNSWVAMETLY